MAVTESKGDGFALYNGVKLPNIDSVWTDDAQETYPYACIGYQNEHYILVICSGESYYDATDGKIKAKEMSNFEADTLQNETWGLMNYGSFPKDYAIGDTSVMSQKWANYDILNTDGTIYLAASDPIPLDGMTVIEWDGNTDGLTVTGTDLGSLVLLSEKVPNTSKPAAEVHISDGGGTQYAYTEKAEYSENGCYYWNGIAWHSYYPNATDIAPTPGIYITSLTANPVTSSLFAFYEGTEEEETDLKPVYMGETGKWVKMTAYERQNGVWALISKAETNMYLYGRVAQEGETPTHTIDGVGYVGAYLPALPVEDANWDVETYPYVFIYRLTSNSNTLLVCSSVRSFFSYNREEAGEFCFNAPGRIYLLENGSFAYYRDMSNVVATGRTEDELQLLWTNHDVLKDDGSVYMAAGYTDFPDAPPVPAEVVVADPCPDKSVMYLYDNGATEDAGDTVTLPAVPEVDLSIYPYLSLSIESSYFSGIVLSATRHPLPYDDYYYSDSPYGMTWRLYDGDSEWTLVWTTQGAAVNVWANYDVYDTDGNLKITASVPRPIYE